MEQAGKGADSDVLLFVYGSLKRGMANHGHLHDTRWLEDAQLQGLALYDLGPFPMAVVSDNNGDVIQGELFCVAPHQLAALDRFEGAPRLYQRRRWPLADGRWAWVYLGAARQVSHVARISSGCWQGPAPNVRRTGPPPANARPQPATAPEPKR
mgnify:CR=1 FL=1|jgi:gamma-glutamylcyclotransferase (GGCT)/AIG2-like uncharacterized protein YtfP